MSIPLVAPPCSSATVSHIGQYITLVVVKVKKQNSTEYLFCLSDFWAVIWIAVAVEKSSWLATTSCAADQSEVEMSSVSAPVIKRQKRGLGVCKCLDTRSPLDAHDRYVFIYILKHTKGPLSLIRISTESEKEARELWKQRYIENPEIQSNMTRGLLVIVRCTLSTLKGFVTVWSGVHFLHRSDLDSKKSSAHFTYIRAQQFNKNQDGGLVFFSSFFPFFFFHLCQRNFFVCE